MSPKRGLTPRQTDRLTDCPAGVKWLGLGLGLVSHETWCRYYKFTVPRVKENSEGERETTRN